MAIITLTTDFGNDDPYIAAMKGVTLDLNPEVTIVDICHNIKPQNVAQAAYILSTTYHYFPRGTVHIAVVDPGVGTERQAVLLITHQAFFLGPDNGVLSYIVEESPLSNTFHGRDIFAPVAAHLSLGVSPYEFGDLIPSIAAFTIPRPQIGKDGVLIGRVIHIDRFGNLISDIKREDLPRGRIFIEVGGHIIDDLSSSYEEEEELLAIIGSGERLEVSLRNGSAARFLGSNIGGEVKVGATKTSLKGSLRL